jgi:hypothetical protein
LDEVKKNLDIVKSEYMKTQQASPIDMVFNLVPSIGKWYYTSPPLRYGSEFTPVTAKTSK